MARIGIVCAGKIDGLIDSDPHELSVYQEVRIADAGHLAKKLETEGAQVIIGTAGTAPVMRRCVSVPVVVVYLACFDVLETLKEIEALYGITGRKVALIFHAANSFDAGRLHPFLNNRISCFTYQTEEQLKQVIYMLFEKDYEILVGGPTTIFFAKQLGIKSHLLTFGKETMEAAINKAKELLELTRKDREQSQQLRTIIELFTEGIISTDRQGIIKICNPRALSLLELPANEVIGHKIEQVVADQTWREVYEAGVKQTDVLMDYKKRKFFSTRQPIVENGNIIGSVGTLQDVSKIQKLENQYRSVQTLGLVAKSTFDDIVGVSPVMMEKINRAKAFARFDSTILIEGKTGTGKEIFAQSIHNASSRRLGPFVAINCATLSETLLESELLGYEEGAFTGARRGGKLGLFELAHKGTIFLDEINQIPLPLQARVLRVIQEKVVMRLGGQRVIPVDVRIIAATNENLKEKVDAGKFRADLYYRINVLTLQLPPLRLRKDDIPVLIGHFMNHFTSTYGVEQLSPKDIVDSISGYDWPGNVRELANFVERFIVLQQDKELKELDFRSELQSQYDEENSAQRDTAGDMLKLKIDTIENMEKQIIRQTVERCSGNKLQAALLLGISRSTLWKKMRGA